MTIHGWELQKTIYAALTGASLTGAAGGAITGVFDDVPEDTAYPYVVVGEDTAINVSAKTLDIHEHTITIHTWSQYRGRKEIKVIMEQIYDTLNDASLSVSGGQLVNLKHEFETTLVEGDGITRHGVMRFRAVVSDS